jgi:hypothetical protein
LEPVALLKLQKLRSLQLRVAHSHVWLLALTHHPTHALAV